MLLPKDLAGGNVVERFDYNLSCDLGFCENCIVGKQHHNSFERLSERQTEDLLGLVHSDVCGKISDKSIGGAQYFLIFTDDKSRYTWVCIIKTKDQVFQCFVEWKAPVEKASKKKIKTLRIENRGEYTSAQFEKYCKGEGIRQCLNCLNKIG